MSDAPQAVVGFMLPILYCPIHGEMLIWSGQSKRKTISYQKCPIAGCPVRGRRQKPPKKLPNSFWDNFLENKATTKPQSDIAA